MILAGSNIRTFKEEVQQLAKHWGCGIAMEYGAAGIIPESDPFGLGGLGEGGNPLLSNLFKQADVVLAIGTCRHPYHPGKCTCHTNSK